MARYISESIHSRLSRLVVTEAVNIQSLNDVTGVNLDPLSNTGMPFTETILNGRELRQLTLPIRVDTKSLPVTVLIEITVITSNELITNALIDGVTGFVPEARVVASIVIVVSREEVHILAFGFPDRT